jgi:hypothetical protein
MEQNDLPTHAAATTDVAVGALHEPSVNWHCPGWMIGSP